MRSQFLWVRRPGFHYHNTGAAPSNINMVGGTKGTIAFWLCQGAERAGNTATILRAGAANGDHLKLWIDGVSRLNFETWNGSVGRTVTTPAGIGATGWVLVAMSWDFTPADGSRVIKLRAGAQATQTLSTIYAPRQNANILQVGPPTTEPNSFLYSAYDNLAIWNGDLTDAEFLALRGSDIYYLDQAYARRRLPKATDVAAASNLTFLATWDGTYNAVVGSDKTAEWEVAAGDYDNFCRLSDSSPGPPVRHQFFFGMPRHDNSPDDRVPIRAVFDLITASGNDQYTSFTNAAEYSQVDVSQLKNGAAEGQGLMGLRPPFVLPPGAQNQDVWRPLTLEMRVHVPTGIEPVNPNGQELSLGPFAWYTWKMSGSWNGHWGPGRAGTVQADGGNSTSQFKTDITGDGNDYWNGAWVTFRSGTGLGYRVRVADYVSATGTFVISGTLPAIPAATDRLVVDARSWLAANPASGSPVDMNSTLEAWLSESWTGPPYGGGADITDRVWMTLEAICGHDTTQLVRYDRGRCVVMPWPYTRGNAIDGNRLCFGRRRGYNPASFNARLWVESLTIRGGGNYDTLDTAGTPFARPAQQSDTFLVEHFLRQVGGPLHSNRVWRAAGLTRAWATLSKYGDFAAIQTSFNAAGTWRNTGYPVYPVMPRTEQDAVTMLVRGTAAGGAITFGYCVGTWNADTGRLVWVDETPPAGKSNPFIAQGDLLPELARDIPWGAGYPPGQVAVIGLPDGSWVLTVGGNADNPDHYYTRAYFAADRWSFTHADSWGPDNPLPKGLHGVEPLGAWGNAGFVGNRDADWQFAYDPFTRVPGRRIFGACRLKSNVPQYTGGTEYLGNPVRHMGGLVTDDFRGFRALPHGGPAQPLAAAQTDGGVQFAAGADAMMHLTTYGMGGGNLGVRVADDHEHWQQPNPNLIATARMACPPFHLGDRTVYYIADGAQSYALNQVVVDRDREVYYALTAGQVGGELVTPVLPRPTGGWDKLLVNVAANAGAITVEVLDPETDTPLTGYAAADMDALADGVRSEVTWGGEGLADIAVDEVRLRLAFTRPTAGDAGPVLYAWYAEGDRAFQLQARRMVTVTVTAVAAPLAGVSLVLVQDNLRWEGETAADGTWTWLLERGAYTLHAGLTGYEIAPPGTVTVAGDDLAVSITATAVPSPLGPFVAIELED